MPEKPPEDDLVNPLGFSREDLIAQNPALAEIFAKGDKEQAESDARVKAERQKPEARQREQQEAYTALIALHDAVCLALEKTRIQLTVPSHNPNEEASAFILNGVELRAQPNSSFETTRIAELQSKKDALETVRGKLAVAIEPVMRQQAISKESVSQLLMILEDLRQIPGFQAADGPSMLYKAGLALNKIKDHD